MKTKMYFFISILMIGMISCGEIKVNEPSKELGFFDLNAKLTDGQHLKVTIINTLPDARGFAYAECLSSQNAMDISPTQLRMCFSDTLAITTVASNKLLLYQFVEAEDGSGIRLQEHETIYLSNFFKIN